MGGGGGGHDPFDIFSSFFGDGGGHPFEGYSSCGRRQRSSRFLGRLCAQSVTGFEVWSFDDLRWMPGIWNEGFRRTMKTLPTLSLMLLICVWS
ncbi:BnaA02g11160D [Brassica napus]|uniref:BnaA02g11160D protein n=1 Tax=Brassica napus TaxID=3708 RepID=A0A078GP67_BRANA|nr:BnaA02g11160D [Brassica napus]